MAEPLKILVLDDEATIRDLACEMLEVLSYKVESAGSYSEAVAKYREAMDSGHPFDLVIFDINLKGDRNGFDTLQEIKKIDDNVKAIAATGFAGPEIGSDNMENVFDLVINKPYTMSVLKDAICKVVDAN
jgi:CheY-like chemotaxis protein